MSESVVELAFVQNKDGLWEKVVDGRVVGIFREVDTKIPPNPVNGTDEEIAARRALGQHKIALMKRDDVEMVWVVGDKGIPRIADLEPVPDAVLPTYSVVKEQPALKTPAEYRDILTKLGEAPDGQFASPLAEICRKFNEEAHEVPEYLNFLRDMRDLSSHTAGASTFVMKVFASLIPDETKAEAEARRSDLLNRYYPGS